MSAMIGKMIDLILIPTCQNLSYQVFISLSKVGNEFQMMIIETPSLKQDHVDRKARPRKS